MGLWCNVKADWTGFWDKMPRVIQYALLALILSGALSLILWTLKS